MGPWRGRTSFPAEGLTPVGVRVRNLLYLPLGLAEEGSDGARVADVAVALKLGADLDCLVPPEVPADVPAGGREVKC